MNFLALQPRVRRCMGFFQRNVLAVGLFDSSELLNAIDSRRLHSGFIPPTVSGKCRKRHLGPPPQSNSLSELYSWAFSSSNPPSRSWNLATKQSRVSSSPVSSCSLVHHSRNHPPIHPLFRTPLSQKAICWSPDCYMTMPVHRSNCYQASESAARL